MKYNNELLQSTKMEKELYSQYQRYKGSTCEEKTKLIIKALNLYINSDPGMSVAFANLPNDDEKIEFLFSRIIPKTANFDFDFKYFWPYNAGNGFSLQIDALFRPKKRGFFFVIYCFNPPGAFYNKGPPEDIHFCSFLDFNHSNQHLYLFKEGYRSHNQINFEENGHILFSIKYILFDRKQRPKIHDYGFAILPLFFEDKYVFSGCFQIPVFAGELEKSSVVSMAKEDPFETLLDVAGKKKVTVGGSSLKFIENCSLIVRLKDNQLDGLFSKSLDFRNMDYRMIPRHKLDSYAYNPEFLKKLYKKNKPKKMNDLFVPKVSLEEMNIIVKETVREAFKLT